MARRRSAGVPTWVWFAGAAIVAYWLLTRKGDATEPSWAEYLKFIANPSYGYNAPVEGTLGPTILEPGVSGGSH